MLLHALSVLFALAALVAALAKNDAWWVLVCLSSMCAVLGTVTGHSRR